MHWPTWHPIHKSNNKMKRGSRLPNQVASMYGSDIQFWEKKKEGKFLFDLLSDPLFIFWLSDPIFELEHNHGRAHNRQLGSYTCFLGGEAHSNNHVEQATRNWIMTEDMHSISLDLMSSLAHTFMAQTLDLMDLLPIDQESLRSSIQKSGPQINGPDHPTKRAYSIYMIPLRHLQRLLCCRLTNLSYSSFWITIPFSRSSEV